MSNQNRDTSIKSERIIIRIPQGKITTKQIVGNVVKFRSIQEEIEYNMETGGEIIESSVEKEGDRIGCKVEKKENGTKKCLHSVETKEKGKEMHKSYADIVRG